MVRPRSIKPDRSGLIDQARASRTGRFDASDADLLIHARPAGNYESSGRDSVPGRNKPNASRGFGDPIRRPIRSAGRP